MPLIIKDKQVFPEWSELKGYEIFYDEEKGERKFVRKYPREKIFCCRGKIRLVYNTSKKTLHQNDVIEIPEAEKEYLVVTEDKNPVYVAAFGTWEENTGNCGVFTMENSSSPKNIGDPVDYPFYTDLDNHFHDCDEFWIFTEGSGKAVSEGKLYKFEAGDCIATRMGDHHDLPEVYEKVEGVYLETTLRGKKRKGHLWDHTHKSSDQKEE